MTDFRNVNDRYKGWMDDLIKEDVQKNTFPFAVLMHHLQGDFNIGGVIRSANAFGAQSVYYAGKRKWDRRGAVGVHNYTNVIYIENLFDSLPDLSKDFNLVALEQCAESYPIQDFQWPDRPLIIIGEEGNGLSDDLLSKCKYKIEIPQYGSVRSLNAASAASIAMHDFVSKFEHQAHNRKDGPKMIEIDALIE